MRDAIEYADLSSENLTACFDRDGFVSVRLSDSHVEACTALIETCVAANHLKGVNLLGGYGLSFAGGGSRHG